MGFSTDIFIFKIPAIDSIMKLNDQLKFRPLRNYAFTFHVHPVFIERMHNCRQTFTIGFLCNVNID